MHSITLTLGAAAILCGLAMFVIGVLPPGFMFLMWGLVIVVGLVFERFRYKANVAKPPAGNWVKTAERFVDPESGVPVTVYTDPQSGERIYVNE